MIKPVFIRFAFPPRWHYDILRALDHFQAVDAPRDARLAEAVAIVAERQNAEGRWLWRTRTRARRTFSSRHRRAEPLEHTPRASCPRLVEPTPGLGARVEAGINDSILALTGTT